LFAKKDLIRKHVRQRFNVTLKDGGEFAGVLMDVSSASFEFFDVVFNGFAAASPLYVDRENVSYIQAVPPPRSEAVIRAIS
jgi:hypothetical protein